jgi:hypothetical protein
MKLYNREDFLDLPKNTIYSRVDETVGEICYGLFCKTSDTSVMENDWFEQDLISEAGFPNALEDGREAIEYALDIRDEYKDFETDLQCIGRDGCFDYDDKFVVWDKKDVIKLIEYLKKTI